MKSKVFPIRLNDEVKALLQQAADKEGVTLTEYIKQAAIDKAKASVYTPAQPKPESGPRPVKDVYTPEPESTHSVYTPKPINKDSGFERFKRFRPTAGDRPSTQQLVREGMFNR